MQLDGETIDSLGTANAWTHGASFEFGALPFVINEGAERREQKRSASETYSRHRRGAKPRVRFSSEAERAAATRARVKRNRSTPEARERDRLRKRRARRAS